MASELSVTTSPDKPFASALEWRSAARGWRSLYRIARLPADLSGQGAAGPGRHRAALWVRDLERQWATSLPRVRGRLAFGDWSFFVGAVLVVLAGSFGLIWLALDGVSQSGTVAHPGGDEPGDEQVDPDSDIPVHS